LLVAHLTRHALALVDALRGEAAADRAAVPEVLVRAVGARHAAHVVLLDDALIALALAPAFDVDRVAVGEDVLRAEDLADRELRDLGGRDADLADEPLRLDVRRLRDAKLGLVRGANRLLVEAEHERRVTVALFGARTHDVARPGLDHGD